MGDKGNECVVPFRGLENRETKTGREGGEKPFIQIHIGFLANQIRVSTAHTLDLGESVHDLLLAIDVGVEEAEDELEVRLLA